MTKQQEIQKIQEVKDLLWRLDDDVSQAAAAIAHSTGEAWKMTVEGGNYRRALLNAANLARELEARIRASIDDGPG